MARSNRKPRARPELPDGWLTDLSLIHAAGEPNSLRIQGESSGFEIEAQAASEDGKPALKKFSMTAYTGGAMNVGWGPPVVVDLEGMQAPSQANPILMAHDSSMIVGHTNKVEITAQRVYVAGVISGVGAAAEEVKALAANGFPWQASIGATVQAREFVDRGQSVKVNGRNFTGPVIVARKTTLGEVSFVAIGADQNTSATVAAQQGGEVMNFEQWLKAKGFDPATLTESGRTVLKAQYDAEQRPAPAPAPAPAPTPTPAAQPNITAELERTLQAARDAAAAEANRQNEITRLTAADPGLETEITENGAARRVNIRVHALAANWTAQQTELAILRAARPRPTESTGPTVYVTNKPEMNEAVLEAAVLHAGQCRLFDDDFYHDREGGRTERRVTARQQRQTQAELAARYPDQVQQAAHTLFRGRIGLQQLLVAAARMEGYRGSEVIRDDGGIEGVLRAQRWIRAEGASTASIANVLANVMNKFLLQGYFFTEQAWRQICGIRSVKDFKATKSVNLLSDATFQDVGPSGELKHTNLTDQAFANQVTTRGRMITISRTHIINDDLGALTQIPQVIGRGAGLKMNSLFWTLFLSPGFDEGGSTNFFATTHTLAAGQSGNANLMSGGTTALSSAALTAAVLLFDNQIDPMGNPLGLDAEILLYGPDLESTAWELMNSQYIVYGGASASKQPANNQWKGRFTPVKSRYINKSAFTGYSTTAWWLLANPGVLPVIEVAFLNGQETPTVQSAEADFDILGISTRGYFDTGVAMQNFRGGVKSAGA